MGDTPPTRKGMEEKINLRASKYNETRIEAIQTLIENSEKGEEIAKRELVRAQEARDTAQKALEKAERDIVNEKRNAKNERLVIDLLSEILADEPQDPEE